MIMSSRDMEDEDMEEWLRPYPLLQPASAVMTIDRRFLLGTLEGGMYILRDNLHLR